MQSTEVGRDARGSENLGRAVLFSGKRRGLLFELRDGYFQSSQGWERFAWKVILEREKLLVELSPSRFIVTLSRNEKIIAA